MPPEGPLHDDPADHDRVHVGTTLLPERGASPAPRSAWPGATAAPLPEGAAPAADITTPVDLGPSPQTTTPLDGLPPVAALPDTTAARLRPGATLGRWVLDGVLGEGATATVWAAHHEALGSKVAIKVFHRRDLPFHTVLGEARAAAGIPSPYVVWVHDVGTLGGHHVMVMELCAPEDRGAQSLRDHDIDDPWSAATLIAQAARGVAAAHAGGVFHKDIKPANILINPTDGRAQITDFGLANPALWRAGTTRGPHTAQATVCVDGLVAAPRDATDPLAPIRGSLRLGTPEFMAPEQAHGLRRDLDPADPLHRRYLTAIDVYGLGATLYHLIAGHPPYPHGFVDASGLDAATIMEQVAAGPPRPLREAAPHVPTRLARIIDKAMARDPRQRHPTAGDLARDLEAWTAQRPTSVDTSRLTRLWVHLKRERARVGLVAALALVTLASTAVVFHNARAIRDQQDALQSQRAELRALEHAHALATRDLQQMGEALLDAEAEVATQGELAATRGRQLAWQSERLAETSSSLASTRQALASQTDALATTEARADALAVDLAAVERSLARAEAELADALAARDGAEAALAEAADRRDEALAARDALAQDVARTQQANAALTARVTALQQDVRTLKRALDDALRERDAARRATPGPPPSPVADDPPALRSQPVMPRVRPAPVLPSPPR